MFPTRSQKQVFLSAMLSLCNVSEHELVAHQTSVLTLQELKEIGPEPTSGLRLVLVGLPAPAAAWKVAPLVRYEAVDVILYPHQYQTLLRRISDWARMLTPDIDGLATSICSLGAAPPPERLPRLTPRLRVATAAVVQVNHTPNKPIAAAGAPWQTGCTLDEVDEVEWLLRSVPDEDGPLIADGGSSAADTTVSGSMEDWCDGAIEVCFDQQWRAMFAPDDQLNVVVQAGARPRLERRFVRALRPSNEILMIAGSQRQDCTSSS